MHQMSDAKGIVVGWWGEKNHGEAGVVSIDGGVGSAVKRGSEWEKGRVKVVWEVNGGGGKVRGSFWRLNASIPQNVTYESTLEGVLS